MNIESGKCPTCDGPAERYNSAMHKGDWYHFLEEDAETCTNREFGGRGEPVGQSEPEGR